MVTHKTGSPSAVETFIEIAVDLFQQKGYPGVSVDELVNAAGVTKGTFYYYLESKGDLLFRIHDRFITHELSEGERILATNESPATKLRMLVRSLVHSIHEYLPYVTVFFNEMRYLEEPYASRIHEKRDRYTAMFEETIRDAVAAGEFSTYLDPRIATLALFGMCNWMYKWYRPGGRLSDIQVADQFLTILMKGLMDHSEGTQYDVVDV